MEHLDAVSPAQGPWMLLGDFNVISSVVEKQGGVESDLGAIHDFQQCISRNGLIDAGYIGENFTWCNNRQGRARIWERLDRALINLAWQRAFPAMTVHHLPRVISDHLPLLIKFHGTPPSLHS